jgi:hypothetical protein
MFCFGGIIPFLFQVYLIQLALLDLLLARSRLCRAASASSWRHGIGWSHECRSSGWCPAAGGGHLYHSYYTFHIS